METITHSQKTRLILGAAGIDKRDPSELAVDNDPRQRPDVLHNLNETPWPFQDNQFEEIVCHHVLEHLEDISRVLGELYRICRPEGTIYMEVPHFSCWQANSPHHKLRFSYFSLDGYIEGEKTWVLSDFKFLLKKRQITFHRAFRRLQLHRLFNRYPLSYERFWTYLFPAEHLKFELRPIKP